MPMTAAPVLSVVISLCNVVQRIGRLLAAVSATLPVKKQIVDRRDGLKALGYLPRLRFSTLGFNQRF